MEAVLTVKLLIETHSVNGYPAITYPHQVGGAAVPVREGEPRAVGCCVLTVFKKKLADQVFAT